MISPRSSQSWFTITGNSFRDLWDYCDFGNCCELRDCEFLSSGVNFAFPFYCF